MKVRVKVYPVTVMSEAEIEAPSEAKAIEIAEAMALRGALKFYSPDRRFVSLIYKEPKLRVSAQPTPPHKTTVVPPPKPGGQDDGS